LIAAVLSNDDPLDLAAVLCEHILDRHAEGHTDPECVATSMP
jgi:hypothetical protein